MSRTNQGGKGKGSGRQGGNSSRPKGGNRRNAGSTDHKGKNQVRGNAPVGKPSPRGGKNQVVGTSRTGKPVTKKQYIERKKAESSPRTTKDDGKMRLNKYIANAGICSRRDADIYIKSGNVTVNGKPVTEMGYRVSITDDVKFDGQSIQPHRKEYLLLNKPKGFIAPRKGERASKTVMDLMSNTGISNLHYVGRLGRQSVGLMLFTNDIEVANKLNNPNLKLRKIYQVALDRSFKHEDLMRLRNGIVIEGEPIEIEEINYVENGRNNELGIEIHSGKDNIVQRIFEHVGYEIKVLDRVVIGGLTKKDLPRGNYRYLTEQEIINLKML
jgi:23S rRNA pseudouridine2605 synthase